MQILSGTKSMARLLDLHTKFQIGPAKIPSGFLKIFTLVSMFSTTIPTCFFAYHHRDDVKIAIAGLFHVVSHLSIGIICLILIKNQNFIVASMENIESVVQKSIKI